MAEFSSGFWNWFIIIPTIVGIVGVVALLVWLSAGTTSSSDKVETMGHVWDGDLEELNNPLPRWWLILFYITVFFAAGYLAWYPGLGEFTGSLRWTQINQYELELIRAEQEYGPLFEKFSQEPIESLVGSEEALEMGERLYATYCTGCHGSDAGGGPGYPNLRDDDWLYGGDPDSITTSISAGRAGVMPPWQEGLGDEGVANVAQYVLHLSGREVDEQAALAGQKLFEANCASCHMPDGTGNPALGAPNLTNNIWLYGGSPKVVEASIANGRQGQMPPHGEFLGEAKVHLLANYIYSLSKASRE